MNAKPAVYRTCLYALEWQLWPGPLTNQILLFTKIKQREITEKGGENIYFLISAHL